MRKKKPYWEMNPDELAQATREFNKPVPLSKTRPLSREQKACFERMRGSRSRSVYVTREANGVFVRLDKRLLQQTMRYASLNKLTLAQVINRSLRGMMTMIDQD
jgi:hypothetical protein